MLCCLLTAYTPHLQVYEQSVAGTADVEAKEANSWDDVPPAGTQGVEIIWDKRCTRLHRPLASAAA
jgi:hypothetical protein